MILGYLGKYNDSYFYCSFGDIFLEKGIWIILIELGVYLNDLNC